MPGGSGTSTDFVPSSTSSCYLPRMTRAQAMALRTAALLDPNCVIVITDGPTIGAGLVTSTTEIELNPTSSTEIGMTARVHTTFDNTPWAGHYDIDLGTGTLIRLEDPLGNIVDDPTGVNVQTAFPWNHPATVAGNQIYGTPTLTGWSVPAAAGVLIKNNIVDGITTAPLVWNMTGLTSASVVYGNKFHHAGNITLASGVGALSFIDNDISELATVNINTGAAPVIFSVNTMTTARLDVVGQVAAINIEENHIYDGIRVNIAPGAGAGVITVNANNLRGANSSPSPAVNIQIDKTAGTLLFDQSDVDNDSDTLQLRFGGAGNDDISLSKLTFPTSGTPQIYTGTGAALILHSTLINHAATVNNAGGVQYQRSIIQGGSTITNGLAQINYFDSKVASTAVSNGVGATRGLVLTNCDLAGTTITQNRTGGVLFDTIRDSVKTAGNIILNGAVDPTVNQLFTRIWGSGFISFTDPLVGLATVCNDLVVTAQSTFTAQAGHGAQQAIRVGGAGTLQTGAFAHTSVTYEIFATQALTASNVNRLRNVGFTNTV